MKKSLSFILACTFILLLPVQAQARMLKPSPKFPSASPDERSDVSKGIYVGDELVTFSETLLFDGRMSIMLPDNFIDMPNEMAHWKFPNRQIVKCNSDGSVYFAFMYLEDEPLAPGDIGERMKDTKESLRSDYPDDYILNGKTEKLGVTLGWLAFKNPTSDMVYFYNMNICCSIDGKYMSASFVCPYSERDKWIPVFQAVLPTIKECEVK